MPWLLALQDHPSSSFIMELPDTWFQQGILSPLLIIRKVQTLFWEMTLLLIIVWGRVGLILTMVP